MLFCRLLIFFKINIFSNSFGNTIRVSNSLDPDQSRHFVGPDLGPNCLQKLPADGASRQRVTSSLSDAVDISVIHPTPTPSESFLYLWSPYWFPTRLFVELLLACVFS